MKNILLLPVLLFLGCAIANAQNRKFPAEYSNASITEGLPSGMPLSLYKADPLKVYYSVLAVPETAVEFYLLREIKKNSEPQFWIYLDDKLEAVSVTGVNYAGDGTAVYGAEFEPADENNIIYHLKFYFLDNRIFYKIYRDSNSFVDVKFNGGVSYEAAFLSAGNKLTFYDPQAGRMIRTEYKNEILLSPLTLTGIMRISVERNYHLEIRPGFSIAGKYYTGVELGIFVRRDFADKYFISLGTIMSSGFGEAHGIMISENTGGRINHSYGIGCGYALSKKSEMSLSVFYLPESDYGHIYNGYNHILTEPYLRWLVRFGVQMNFGKPSGS